MNFGLDIGGGGGGLEFRLAKKFFSSQNHYVVILIFLQMHKLGYLLPLHATISFSLLLNKIFISTMPCGNLFTALKYLFEKNPASPHHDICFIKHFNNF